MTGADGGHEHRGVGGHQAQALPARHHRGGLGATEHSIVGPVQRRHVQARARLGESPIRHRPDQAGPAVGGRAQVGEEGVEQGLLRARAHRQQRRDQRRQGQLAVAREGLRKLGMPCALREIDRGKYVSKIQQQGLDRITVLRPPCEMTSKIAFKSTAYGQQYTLNGLSSEHRGEYVPPTVP